MRTRALCLAIVLSLVTGHMRPAMAQVDRQRAQEPCSTRSAPSWFQTRAVFFGPYRHKAEAGTLEAERAYRSRATAASAVCRRRCAAMGAPLSETDGPSPPNPDG
jgi:hypothetical protein